MFAISQYPYLRANDFVVFLWSDEMDAPLSNSNSKNKNQLASYNQMKTEQSQQAFLKVALQDLTEIQANSDLMRILKQKIQQHSYNKINKSQQIDVDALQESSQPKQLFDSLLWQQAQSFLNDEEYVPQFDSSQSESVQRYKIHNLRMREIKSITKAQFEKKLLPNEPIEIEDVKPEENHFSLKKQEYVKLNFKQQMRGRVTKKTKMQSLLKNKGVRGYKGKSQKIMKSLKKLAKQLQ